MGDICDKTDERLEKEEKIRRAIRELPKAVSKTCVECGDNISKARQQATGGTELCINCAQQEEFKTRMYR